MPAFHAPTPTLAAPPTAGVLERMAWVGLIAGLLLVASAAALPHPPPGLALAFGPHDLTSWVEAICGSIGAVTAALNGLAITWHRWGRPPRRPRRASDPRREPLPPPPPR